MWQYKLAWTGQLVWLLNKTMIGYIQVQRGISPSRVTPGLQTPLVRELGGTKMKPIRCLDGGLLNLLQKRKQHNKPGCVLQETLGSVSSPSQTSPLLLAGKMSGFEIY